MPTVLPGSASYSVNGLNQITTETIGGTASSLTYDDNGNLVSDGTGSYSYDLFNRLTSALGSTSIEYDASGRLYSIVTSASNTYFLYDGAALIAEYTVDGSGNVSLVRRYVHGFDVDTPIVWYEGATVSNATRRYLLRDELGSVVLITDSNGGAVQHNTYDEYGVPGTSNIGRFQYTGQSWLEEAELYYYKARVYNPNLGRFHQTDPIGYGDGLNMYAYVGNDPVNKIDPLGEAEVFSQEGQFIEERDPEDDNVYVRMPEGDISLDISVDDFHAVSATVYGEGPPTGRTAAEATATANVIANSGAPRGESLVESATSTRFSARNQEAANDYQQRWRQGGASEAPAARAGVISVLTGQPDPTDGRTMFEGTALIGSPVSDFEDYINNGVAYDPLVIGRTTYFRERTQEQADRLGQ